MWKFISLALLLAASSANSMSFGIPNIININPPTKAPLVNVTQTLGALQTQIWPAVRDILKGVVTNPSTSFYTASLKIGELQCQGLGKVLGISGTILGDSSGTVALVNDKNITPSQISGHTICNETCSGSCVPFNNSAQVAPPSLYPLICDCPVATEAKPNGCDANGPRGGAGTTTLVGPFKYQCEKSEECKCNILSNPAESYTGYICNWWTLNNKTIALGPNDDLVLASATLQYNPALSPIRWCDCCPNQ